jgi:MOSC domain-containing protein YiiM
MTGTVIAVSISSNHFFSKSQQNKIKLIAGIGIEGDAHAGRTVKHRSRVTKDPSQPNLRQVHLIQTELHDELKDKGFDISPGDMGENITTKGIDLLNLPTNTKLYLGDRAVIKVTGLRNPCAQLDAFQPGLMSAVLDRDAAGRIIRKAGVMSVVVSGGVVKIGDRICIELPPQPYRLLERV